MPSDLPPSAPPLLGWYGDDFTGATDTLATLAHAQWRALLFLGVPTPVMTLALMSRFASQGQGDFANRMLAMMRKGFGGHAVKEGAGETTPPFHKGGLGGI